VYAVVCRYPEASALANVIDSKQAEVEQIPRGGPVVVAYYAFRTGDGVATVTIAEDQAGTQESSRRAADWVRQQGLSGGSGRAPEITEGEVFLQFS
jgi:hypothetical protein